MGACVLERLPVVVPRPSDWELEHAAWQQQLAERRRKVLPREFTDPKQSEELAAAEGGAGRWKPADRETEADRSGDRRALRRRLDQFLFLLASPLPSPLLSPAVHLSYANAAAQLRCYRVALPLPGHYAAAPEKPLQGSAGRRAAGGCRGAPDAAA